MKTHFTAPYLLNPQHPVTVYLIGVGGTGSQMLNNLARINSALVALGHPGLHVTAWDDDVVTEANLGRQLFSSAELEMNKAVALVTRVNRFFGLQWEAKAERFDLKKHNAQANIIITCVDAVDLRIDLDKSYKGGRNGRFGGDENNNYYWLDLGNTKDAGQCVLASRYEIEQPKKIKDTIGKLPTIVDLFPNIKKLAKEDNTPSCSLAEALSKQDLFINSILAQYGSNIIWKLFRELKLDHHGVFINLKTLATSPIKIQ